MYDGRKKAWNWEKYVAQHIKYHMILGNLMKYGHQWLDPKLKVWYLLNGIRCDKLSIAVTVVRAYPDKYENDFYPLVIFLNQYIDNRAPTSSVKIASVGQTRPVKWKKTSAPFKRMIQLKKYSREEYVTMLMA